MPAESAGSVQDRNRRRATAAAPGLPRGLQKAPKPLRWMDAGRRQWPCCLSELVRSAHAAGGGDK